MEKHRLVVLGVYANAVLFGAKLWAGLLSHSTAVLSDALNSGLDLIVAAIVSYSVRLHEQDADEDHHYGHRRAEPLASLLLAAVAVMLGMSIVKDGVVGLTEHHVVHVMPSVVHVLYGALGLKVVLWALYAIAYRRSGSTVMHSTMLDSRNDILATAVALAGYRISGNWDDVAGIAIGVWIIASGMQTAWPNVKLLMGAAPGQPMMRRLAEAAKSVPGVLGVHGLRAHFVGDRLHVEVHIEVEPSLPLVAAHAVGEAVRQRLEALPAVQRAFVQVDPAL